MRWLAVFVVVAVFAAYVLGGMVNDHTMVTREPSAGDTQVIYRQFEPYSIDLSRNPDGSTAVIIVPAVDQDGKGVPTFMQVQVVPGTGKALVNIDKLLFWVDTQNSIRTARSVAEMVTEGNLSESDIVYTITANASVVEGPSAGAALTVATVAALEGKQVNTSVMMTGTVSSDGKIGPIGEPLEKARAAKSIGAELFLVPPGQSVEVKYETRRRCDQMGWAEYCTTENIPIRLNISEEVGIRIEEVGNINEALEYFLVDWHGQ